MRKLAIVLCAAAFLVTTSGLAFATTETPVETGSANQFGASAGDGLLSWTQIDKATKQYGTFLKDTGPADTINKPGTTGYGGGFNGSQLVYQQVPKNTNSDVFAYDVVTQVRTPVDIANTKFWEWEPTASGDWVLVGRANTNTSAKTPWYKVVLVNTVTLDQRTLASVSGSKVSLRASQVNGDTASWERCSTTDCQAYFYDIPTQVTTTISSTSLDYAPAVAADGTQYFFRSGKGCGKNVQIYRQEPGDPTPTLIYSFPNGMYGGDAYIDSTAGHEDLYYARASCAGSQQDIYAITNADTALAADRTPARIADTSASSSSKAGILARLRALDPGRPVPQR